MTPGQIAAAGFLCCALAITACSSSADDISETGKATEVGASGASPTGIPERPTTSEEEATISCLETPVLRSLRPGVSDLSEGAVVARLPRLVADRYNQGFWFTTNGYREETLRITAEQLNGSGSALEWNPSRLDVLDPADQGLGLPDWRYPFFVQLPEPGCWRFTAHVGKELAEFTVRVYGEPVPIEPRSDLNPGGNCSGRFVEARAHALFAALNAQDADQIAELFTAQGDWDFELWLGIPDIDQAIRDGGSARVSNVDELRRLLPRLDELHFVFVHPPIGQIGADGATATVGPVLWRVTGSAAQEQGEEVVDGGGKIQVNCANGLFDRVLLNPLETSLHGG